MNRTQKGKRIERELDRKLVELGFLTHKAVSSWFNRNDIFGCFDHMAKHPLSPTYTFYIQTSARSKSASELAGVVSFPHGEYDIILFAKRENHKPFKFKLLDRQTRVWLQVDDDYIESMVGVFKGKV